MTENTMTKKKLIKLLKQTTRKEKLKLDANRKDAVSWVKKQKDKTVKVVLPNFENSKSTNKYIDIVFELAANTDKERDNND